MGTLPVYNAIKAYLTANWTSCPMLYENENNSLEDTPETFVLAEITGNTPEQRSIGAPGGNLHRQNGLLWFHVMVPSGSGSSVARGYVDALVDLFRELQIGDLNLFFGASSTGLGELGSDDGNYWRLSTSIEWQQDNQRS